jgi:hypothetical protein
MWKKIEIVVFLFCLSLFGSEIFTEITKEEIKYWEGGKGQAIFSPKIIVSDDCVVGKNSIKAEVVDKGDYQGIVLNLPSPVDLSNYDGILFYIKQGYYPKRKANCVLRINFDDNFFIWTDFDSGDGEWTKVYIPFDKLRWKGFMNREVKFGKVVSIVWYPYSVMNEPKEFIMIDGLEFVSKKVGTDKISINRYNYISQIPDIDKRLNLLTDGIVDKEKQVIFPPSSESPEIVFDLGGMYKVEKIVVEAIAIPSQNISNIIIFCSFDGEKWEHIGNILNEDTEGTEKHQIIKIENVEGVGKFVKLRINRLRHDCSIYLGEVSIYGRLANEDDMKSFVMKRYSVGPEMPELKEENYVVMKEGDIEVWIDKKTGVIGSIFKAKKKVIERVYSEYIFAERGKREKSDGYKDEVISIKKEKNNLIRMRIRNKELPYFEVEKIYKIIDKRLEEILSFENLIEKEYFLYVKTNVILDKEFRKNGVYESWGGGHKLERKFAEDIIFDFPAEYAPCLSFENFKENNVLFYYRYKKDGNYTPLSYSVGGFGAIEKDSLIFTSNGWSVGDATFKMEKKGKHNLETHLLILDGTLLNAYDYYLNLPEVKDFRSSIKRPEWLKDIKVEGDFGWEGLWKGAKERILQRYLSLFRDGYIIFPGLGDMDFIWGELPTEGEVRNLFGGVQKAEELKEELDKLKDMGKGRVKFGIYTWLWSDSPLSKSFKEHPEWYIRKSETGGDLIYFPGVNENYYRMASIKESMDEMFERVHKLVNYYNLDIWYLDGGGGNEIVEWENMRIDDYSGWHKLYSDLRNTLQKEDQNRIVFFNHPENPLCDMGYFESFGWTLQKNWRPGAAWMWKFKLFQYKDPLHYPCFIYWIPSTEGYFEDYLVGMGLIPCLNSRELQPKDVAYVSASYEIRPVEIVEANLKPNWRFDKDTEIESFALKREGCGIVFLKSHYEKDVEIDAGFDLIPLGINDRGKKIYSWLFFIKNAKKWDGRFGEIELQDIYEKTGWVFDRVIKPVFIGEENWNGRIEKKIKLSPEEGTLLIITQTPTFVYSIENLPTQLWLPQVCGVKVDGEIKNDIIKIHVSSKKEIAEIGVILPEKMIPETIYCGKEKIEGRIGLTEDKRFLIIPVKKGNWNVICKLKKSEVLQSFPNVDISQPVPGKGMSVKLSFKDEWIGKKFIAEIEKEGKIYYLKNYILPSSDYEIKIPVPEQMEKGKFNFIVSDISGNLRKSVEIEFSEGKPKTKLLPSLLPLPVDSGVKEVSKKKENIEIYSYGWEYSKGAGNFEINPEEAKIKIYTLPMYESHWNCITAGLEMKVERYLKLKIKGNFDFFNKYQMYQTHSPRWNNENYFIGLIIDFHTATGYTKRVACGLGIIKENRKSKVPSFWGTKKTPDEFYSLSDFALRKDINEEIFWIDLKQIGAPEEWDGKIWIAPLLEIVNPDRQLTIEILDTKPSSPEEIKKGINLSSKIEEKKIFEVKKAKGEIKIDGKLDENDWKEAIKIDDFSLLYFPAIKVPQKTEVYILYDEKSLYFGFVCEEKEKDVLSLDDSKPWSNDGIEFLFGLNGIEGYFHGIIDGAGRIYQEIEKNGKKDTITIPKFDYAVYSEKGKFSIEVKLPFEVININNPEGKIVGFNFMRNRLYKGDRQYFTLVPGSSYFVKDRYFLKFK